MTFASSFYPFFLLIALKLSEKITLGIYIAFIADQSLEAPLRAFPSNQHNLLSVIQSWIDEIE
ncbi:hypothetical protein DSM106972_033970 [Dulcicalothrix desertica PCC 7102]|uniref:NACHT C-terminal Alpha/Beta domain-containing protein n=1 Tax=Dulcicalothrix desertica PCC 7102 TaxID=232991 RepID=A0A433VJB2_9CYAN|nr:histidine kinase [Dulcicalothrix desertica]RUT06191.1 hypothetical protein DSM106972_033970 [Dulcicalothrix desertica PCC 7102]TWH54147.1 hypothetical protein CAL7102_02157 [Dulcicalothrix desertica PCC 7102]